LKTALSAVLTTAAVAALSQSPAHASSDKAWAAFNAKATRSCVAASGIRNARPSSMVGFDDRVGKVAILVSDRTRGSAVSKLCLYDKRSQKAFVDDAEMWSAPPQR
jgi:hypothetical protein